MKKIVAIMFAFMLVACGGGGGLEQQQAEETPPALTQEQQKGIESALAAQMERTRIMNLNLERAKQGLPPLPVPR